MSVRYRLENKYMHMLYRYSFTINDLKILINRKLGGSDNICYMQVYKLLFNGFRFLTIILFLKFIGYLLFMDIERNVDVILQETARERSKKK